MGNVIVSEFGVMLDKASERGRIAEACKGYGLKRVADSDRPQPVGILSLPRFIT